MNNSKTENEHKLKIAKCNNLISRNEKLQLVLTIEYVPKCNVIS